MMSIILLLLFTDGATIAMLQLLGSFFGSHYSLTPRSNLEFPITLRCMFWLWEEAKVPGGEPSKDVIRM